MTILARRKFFIAGAAALGTTMLVRPREADATVKNPLVLRPLGNGQDDWPTLLNYAVSCAYKCPIILLPGINGEPWLCKSVGVLPSGTVIMGTPGTVIVQSLKNGTGDPRVAAFSNHYVPYPTIESALTKPVTPGDTTVSVLDNVFTAGNYILIEELSSGGMRLAIYKVFSVSGSGPFVLTLDRPVQYPFAENDPVNLVDPVCDIQILGNGMTMTGTGSRYVEFLGGINCNVSDINFDSSKGSVDERLVSFDVPSANCHMERLTGDGGGTATFGFSFEGADSSTATACHVMNCTIGGYVLQDSVQCSLVNCHARENGTGICVISASTNFEGSSDCSIMGGSFTKNGGGISIESGSSNTRILAATISSNQREGLTFASGSYHLANTTISQCTFEANGASAIDLSKSALKTTVADCVFNGNAAALTVSAGASGTTLRGLLLTDNGLNIASDCDIASVTATMSSSGSTVVLMRSGAVVTGRDLAVVSGAPGNVVLAIENAVANLSQVTMSIPPMSNGIVAAGIGAVVTLSDVKVTPSGSVMGTVGLFAATGTIRTREGVDVATCQTPMYTQSGGYLSVGDVTANGASQLDVAWPDLKVSDYVVLTRIKAIGTPTDMPSVAKTPGTGFSITPDANDGSIYEYWVGELPANCG